VCMWGAGVSLSRGLCWFIPVVTVGIPHAAYLLTCWSVFPKQIWSQHLEVQEPFWFLNVTWCGEALCRLGVQGIKVVLLLGGFFSAKCGSCILAIVLIYRVHTVCFLPLVAILDHFSFIFSLILLLLLSNSFVLDFYSSIKSCRNMLFICIILTF
jgi:hypothetical protein